MSSDTEEIELLPSLSSASSNGLNTPSVIKNPPKNVNMELAGIVQAKITEITATNPYSKYVLSLKKVKKTLLEHPVPFVSQAQLISDVRGIGPTTAKLFDAYFSTKNPLMDVSINHESTQNTSSYETVHSSLASSTPSFQRHAPISTPPSISRFSNASESCVFHPDNSFLPAYRSPSYAILLSLFEFSRGVDAKDALVTRVGLISFTRKYTSSKMEDVGTWQTGIQVLIQHKLVKEIRVKSKTFYCLTVKGRDVAVHLETRQGSDPRGTNAVEETFSTTRLQPVPCPLSKKRGWEEDEEENDMESFEWFPPPSECLDADSLIESQQSRRSELAPFKPPFYLTKPKEESLRLLLDTREHIANDRSYFQTELALAGLQVSTRALSLGDIVWVTAQDEVVNVVVERKRYDDLLRSMQEPRFREQIWRLKQSRAHVYYVLERPTNFFVSPAEQATLAALQAELVLHGFHVHSCDTVSETVLFLKMVTETLVRRAHPCEPYPEFYRRTLKSSYMPLQAIHTRMLQTIKGLSLEKAQGLVRKYPTLLDLYEAIHHPMDFANYLADQNDALGRKRVGPHLAAFIKSLMTETKYTS